MAVLRAYKLVLSPLFAGSCRFTPSCSDYAAQAVRTHGVMWGVLLGGWRLARCNPFGSHGFDPVPPPRRVGRCATLTCPHPGPAHQRPAARVH